MCLPVCITCFQFSLGCITIIEFYSWELRLSRCFDAAFLIGCRTVSRPTITLSRQWVSSGGPVTAPLLQPPANGPEPMRLFQKPPIFRLLFFYPDFSLLHSPVGSTLTGLGILDDPLPLWADTPSSLCPECPVQALGICSFLSPVLPHSPPPTGLLFQLGWSFPLLTT